MAEKLKVLVVAQTPPPFHGQSIMTQYLLEGRYETVELHHVSATTADNQPVPLLKLILQIAKLRRALRPEVLYFAPSPTNTKAFLRDCAILIATRRKFPKVVLHLYIEGLAEFHARLSGLKQTLFRLAYDKPDVAISISKNGLRDAGFLHARQTALVPNGVPDVFWEDGPRARYNSIPTILFLGMVCEEKGVGVLIEACKLLQARGVKFSCKIAGRASSEEELAKLREKAAELGNLVSFVGPVNGDAKWELFAECDVFCFPTYYASESFGLVVIEAMMSGMPVVASNWRALPEIVAEGKTGFLTPVQDAKATSDKLAKLLRDPILRHVMGNSARNRFLDHYRVDVFQHAMENALGLARGERPINAQL